MTTVLVTGGAGFIATHTDIELLNKGYDVISVDNYGNSSPVALERVEQITGKPVKRYDGDVRDEALMERVFTENNIDWVIHFAGLKAVGESVAKPIEYYDNNLYSTLVLLKVMKKHNVKKIIFSSSATKEGVFVYNLGTGHGYSVLEVIKAYEKAAGHPIPYVIKPRRPGDIAACYADASKAAKELDWKAELTIDDMAASSLNWQTKNPNGFRDAE